MTSDSLKSALRLDCEEQIARIVADIRHKVKFMHRKGVVIGVSGGIDSSVCAALCARALPGRVFALMMPEGESSGESVDLALALTRTFGIQSLIEDLTSTLREVGCYQRRNDAIRRLVPEFTEAYKCKIALPALSDDNILRTFFLVVQSPEGERKKVRMDYSTYMTVVAASNFKQRTRKMVEYYHADRLEYAVIGTPNRLEYDQGFFVKNGDGAADIKPIAHLYKTQVYDLARALCVPQEIIDRPPTTDTYSMPQSQEEFYFSLPYNLMDLCLYAYNHGTSASDVAKELDLRESQVLRIFDDFAAKRKATRYAHLAPQLVEPVFDRGHFYVDEPGSAPTRIGGLPT